MLFSGLIFALWISSGNAFNFPGESDVGPGVDLTKQGTVITPAIVTPTNSCVCVPTGSCNFTSGSTDGSGLIDIRIVVSVILKSIIIQYFRKNSNVNYYQLGNLMNSNLSKGQKL